MLGRNFSIKIFCLLLCAALFITQAAQAQSGYLSAGNKLEVWVEDSLRANEYLNQFDIQYSNDNWLVGARLETDEEGRWDDDRETELVRRYAEYCDDYLTLRGGNFYATFGRGLLLRAMEDDEVRIDRDLDGIHGLVMWRNLEGQAFFGRPKNDDTLDRDHLLSGVDLGFQLTDEFNVGAGYVRMDADGDDVDESILGRPIEELAGGRFQFMHGAFDGYIEGAKRFRRGDVDALEGWIGTDAEDGRAWYGAMSVSLPGYAFLIEGKDYYRFDATYSTPPATNSEGMPLNNGFDERGFGLSATMSPIDEMTIYADGSLAEAQDDDAMRNSASGYLRREWYGKGAIQIGGEWYDGEKTTDGYEERFHAGPLLEVSYYLSEDLSVQFKGHFFIRDDLSTERQEYNETQTDLTISHSSARSLTFSLIKASEELVKYENEDTWLTVQFTCTLNHKHDLNLKFGNVRGGINCSGGVCVTEDPFSGFRMELVSRL